MQAKKQRIHWVDQAKAIGLLIVMMIHAPIPEELAHYLRSFSMPRFFVIGGLFLSLHQPFWEYVSGKFSRLIRPYLGFSVLTYLLWLGLQAYSPDPTSTNPLKPFLWILYGSGGGGMVHNRPLWFLPCLFATLIVVYGLNKIPRPWIYPVLIVTAVLGYGVMSITVGETRPPWSLDLLLTTATLAMAGVLARPFFLKSPPLEWPWILFLFSVSVSTAFSNVFVRLSAADVGNGLLFYVSALAGTLLTMDLAKRMPYNSFLSYIGRNTLPIYALHVPVYLIIDALSREGVVPSSYLAEQPVLQTALYLTAGLFLPLLAIQVYERILTRIPYRTFRVPDLSSWALSGRIGKPSLTLQDKNAG